MERDEKKRNYFLGILISFTGLIIVGIIRFFELKTDDLWGIIIENIEILIYLSIVIGWIVSVNRRIISNRLRKYLMFIALLMILWIVIRSIKWNYAYNDNMKRILWYMYYLPMIYIPLLMFFCTGYMGDIDEEVVQKSRRWLYIIAGLLFLLVMTNDIHDCVFIVKDIDSYSYNWGYYCIVFFIGSLVFMWTVRIIRTNARNTTGKKKYIIFVLWGGILTYFVGYYFNNTVRGVGFIEIMAMFDWFVAVFWETCVVIGLVPVNSRYSYFFHNASLRAQIVDKEGKSYISARNAVKIDDRTFREIVQNSCKYYNSRTLLQLYPISCGYVIWQEDIGKINGMIEELIANQEELKEKHAIEKEAMHAKIIENRIEEQNRLYSLLTDEMREGISRINMLSAQMMELDNNVEIEVYRKLLARINLVGNFIKRRSNFIMISEQQGFIHPEELRLCMAEIKRNLEYCNLDFTFEINVAGQLSRYEVLPFLDSFQTVIEEVLFSFDKIHFKLEEKAESLILNYQFPRQNTISYEIRRVGYVHK